MAMFKMQKLTQQMNTLGRACLILSKKSFDHRVASASERTLWCGSSAVTTLDTNSHICVSTSVPIVPSYRPPYRCFHSTHNVQGKIVPYLLSDIGEGIREVNVKEWYVSVGDSVAQFDSICEVQSDKASVTITSRFDGVITKLYHEVEDVALVGKPLVDIELDNEEAGEDAVVDEVEDEVVADTDQSAHSVITQDIKGYKVLATPAVRRLASENKINLRDIAGTGKDGRVLKEDVLRFLKEDSPPVTVRAAVATPTSAAHLTSTSQIPAPSAPSSAPSQPQRVVDPRQPNPASPHITPYIPRLVASHLGDDEKHPIKGIQKAMFKTMNQALEIPHFGYNDEVDISALMALRGKMRDAARERGINFSYMPIFVKAASLALHYFPVLNASLDDKLENVIYKASHNIGFAMDTPNGLVVPNVKNVQASSVFEVAAEMNRLMVAGREGKLKSEDLTGGTFTLSNIGTIGGTYASPVIFPPQVAIGAIGKKKKVPTATLR